MKDHELFSIDKPRKSIREEELIREIMAFSQVNEGKPISKRAYNNWAGARFSAETISRYFGTWEDGCRNAGVRFLKKDQYSDEELIEHFEVVWRWRGQRLVTRDLHEYNKKHKTTLHSVAYSRRWGSFQTFVRLFSQYKLGQITFEQLVESKKQKNLREPITPALRAKVLRRDNYTCRDCGASPRNDPNIILHIHHVIPVSKGGKTELSNLVTNCNLCNLGKGDKIF
jgi:hypothetical protein